MAVGTVGIGGVKAHAPASGAPSGGPPSFSVGVPPSVFELEANGEHVAVAKSAAKIHGLDARRTKTIAVTACQHHETEGFSRTLFP